ncbi:MAG TPA: nucleotidyltransferase family protein [Actinomycetota bacterium]|nr:nucleotidyltransferase family protein [Actinomycetota bacterium]
MISAIVLAAGEGTRFGGTKQLEVVRGAPLVQHAIDAASSAGIGEIVLVLGHDADRVRAALDLPAIARIIVNERYREGQSTSLIAGLGALDDGSDAAIVLLADQPGISPEHIRALIEAFMPAAPTAVRLRFRDGPGPALIPRGIWARVRALEGDTGARALFDAHPELVEEITLDEDAPVDVDRRADLGRA